MVILHKIITIFFYIIKVHATLFKGKHTHTHTKRLHRCPFRVLHLARFMNQSFWHFGVVSLIACLLNKHSPGPFFGGIVLTSPGGNEISPFINKLEQLKSFRKRLEFSNYHKLWFLVRFQVLKGQYISFTLDQNTWPLRAFDPKSWPCPDPKQERLRQFYSLHGMCESSFLRGVCFPYATHIS